MIINFKWRDVYVIRKDMKPVRMKRMEMRGKFP